MYYSTHGQKSKDFFAKDPQANGYASLGVTLSRGTGNLSEPLDNRSDRGYNIGSGVSRLRLKGKVIRMSIKVGLRTIEKWNESLENQVLRYEAEQAPQGKIVFYGPSNFTRWSTRFGMKPMQEVLLGQSGAPCAINRGFGSSCAEHQLYYYPRMVRPLAPSVLVYSTMGNMGPFGYSLEETWMLEERVIT
jgi:hypothetical protein